MTLAEKREIKKEELSTGSEVNTNIRFFFSFHSLPFLEKFKEEVRKNKPNIIIAEERPDPKFNLMVEGKISIAEYMHGYTYPFPEYCINFYELLRELRREGVRIAGLLPILASKDTYSAVREAEERMNRSIQYGDFGGAVDAMLDIIAVHSQPLKLADEMRAREIAKRVKSGEWRGSILVEIGAGHTRVKNLLKKELEGFQEVSVTSVYPVRKSVEEIFRKGVIDVYRPSDELTRLYLYEKKPSEEMKRLIGARAVIHNLIIDISPENFKQDLIYRATSIVNHLSYDECEKMFGEIIKMDTEMAFTYVDKYLKKRILDEYIRERIKKMS
ncbi:hypothetical protein H0N99_00510 [Candidatus Micrarchaeota archaeon]|nr:hypothetical protein [Candidatus Micrarchaeota archaeon]